MKRPGLIIMILSCALMSSCSWAKHRYQWVKDHLPTLPSRSSQSASLVSIQPTRAQQAEARRLLSSIHRQEASSAQDKEQELTRQLMLPEAPPPMQETTYRGGQAAASSPQPTVATPQSAAAPPTYYTQPASAPVADPYANNRFVPRGTPARTPQEAEYTTPTEPDAAQLRGLRSPTLPQALPMDIDGKLRSPSNR